MGVGMPTDMAARYREKAAECLDVARVTVDPSERIRLLDIADAYIRLAEHTVHWTSGHLDRHLDRTMLKVDDLREP
jgi:hypothetical protein